MAKVNLGRVVGYSALEIYNKVNGTSLTEDEFAKLLISDKTTFNSRDEAENYLKTEACQGGQICKILEDNEYVVYIVQPTTDSNGWWLMPLTSQGGNSSGTDDYNSLKNIPKLNGEKIIGNKTSEDYGIKQIRALTNSEIEELINSFI